MLPELVALPWQQAPQGGRATSGRTPTDEQLHEVRIQAKRARYAPRPRPGRCPKAAPFAQAVAALQDVLGDQHDAVVAEAWLRDTVVAA